jgi:general secretion pathway protein K
VDALDALADWVDRDSAPRPDGAEDSWYSVRPIPVLPPNGPITRVVEIASVRNVSPAALEAVRPFVSALPPGTSVNVNTASREVLAAVLAEGPPEAVDALVAMRRTQPFRTTADFRSRLPPGAQVENEQALDVKSRYFEVSVEARQGAAVARARALVRRDPDRWPAIVWQVVE